MEQRRPANLERLRGPEMQEFATRGTQTVVDRPLDKGMAEAIPMAFPMKHPGRHRFLDGRQE